VDNLMTWVIYYRGDGNDAVARRISRGVYSTHGTAGLPSNILLFPGSIAVSLPKSILRPRLLLRKMLLLQTVSPAGAYAYVDTGLCQHFSHRH
jgi:hypothetical protein